CTSPAPSSRWFSVMERTWLTSSAARTSRSRLGSELTDSTGMPSLATSERARAPSMRLVIWLSWSRNIAPASPPDALQVTAQEKGLASPPLRRTGPAGRLISREKIVREQIAGFDGVHLGECAGLGGHRLGELGDPLQRHGAFRLAAQDLAEDPLGLRRVALPQVELAQCRGGDGLGSRLGLEDRLGLGSDKLRLGSDKLGRGGCGPWQLLLHPPRLDGLGLHWLQHFGGRIEMEQALG